MGNLNFDDVMNFYSKHNRSIFGKIVAAQKKSGLIPFVGAGLSAFCGYKLWGDVLRDLAEFILVDDNRQAVLNRIGEADYEEAAQMILEAYPAMLDQLPDLISPDKLSACPPSKLKASAVYTLPYLFQKGLIITTNFDRVLETVYLKCKDVPIQTVTPNQKDLLGQLRQNLSLGLFKLHGDISSDTVAIDDLVFTRDQYDRKYADDSDLVKELTRWFENRRLLFLGCSLSMDRTMDVLKCVTRSQPGIRHYAILGCKKNDIPRRLQELSCLGILPIFYDDSNHDAVRIILERLLEETDQISYNKLKAESRVISPATKEERRLLFDADYFRFSGRTQELEKLEAFCENEEKISWWAVTGPGGMGKSRLVYEFTNRKCIEGWNIKRFEAHPSKDSNANCIEDLDSWSPEVPRTIVVLDDVQAYMESVKRWLNIIVRRHRSEKLRILLLERDGEDLNSAPWLGGESCDNIPVEWCYCEKFLCLGTMGDSDLMAIMDDFASAAGKKLNAELLLKTLERIDPTLKRPMYAVAIADARCQGKDPTNWNRKQVLDTLLNRELDFHFNRLRGMIGKTPSKTLCTELKELLAYSCVRGFIFLDSFIKTYKERYPKLSNKISDVDMDPQDFFEGLGILRIITVRSIKFDSSGVPIGTFSEAEQKKIITLSCSDIIKEHLVLNLALDSGKQDLLFPAQWEQLPGQLSFLGKLLLDYSDRLKEQPDFWETFFHGKPESILCIRLYGQILWGYIVKYPETASRAIDLLAKLYDETKHDSEIANFYAHGLYASSIEQNLTELTKTVNILEQLYINHPAIPEIAVIYANGLKDLAFNDDFKGHNETVKKLEDLYQAHSGNQQISVNLMSVLRYLGTIRDCQFYLQVMDKCEEIYASHLDCKEVNVEFSICLVNLSYYQKNESDVLKTLNRSRSILDKYPENIDIQLSYAMTWFNLTLQQCDTDIPSSITSIADFLRTHPSIIQQFKIHLAEYLSDHPDHVIRYQLLSELE